MNVAGFGGGSQNTHLQIDVRLGGSRPAANPCLCPQHGLSSDYVFRTGNVRNCGVADGRRGININTIIRRNQPADQDVTGNSRSQTQMLIDTVAGPRMNRQVTTGIGDKQ